MAVTLRDVAHRAGYSVTTVSRALNGFDDVNIETRRHIEAVARELGYIPNLSARQLQTRRAHILGFVIPAAPERLAEPFFSEFLTAVSVAAAQFGYDLLISAHAPDAHELDAYRRLVQGGRVDGMILIRGRQDDPRVALLRELGIPFALFGRAGEANDFAWVDVDGETGVRAATEHLLALGHRRIAHLSGPRHYSFVGRRRAGYEAAMHAAGLAPMVRAVESLTEEAGLRAARALLAAPERPTAIIAQTDLVAFGVMRAAHEAGLRVGRELAVIGFDGLATSAYSTPPLTTIAQPITEIGGRLVEMLVGQIITPTDPPPHLLLPATLIVRESSTGVLGAEGNGAVAER